ncbi:MAG: proteasome assembly chaperone family protein, partial [Methanothrix sp.]
MKDTLVSRIKEVTLKDPILVEGLPGVGHVGKLVAD